MSAELRPLITNLFALAVIGAAFFWLTSRPLPAEAPVVSGIATTTEEISIAPKPDATTTPPAEKPSEAIVQKPAETAPAAETSAGAGDKIARIESPYSTPILPISVINASTRQALVNIVCMPRQGGGFSPISASGVIIDPRGVILTNAHVAQYLLLSQDPRINITCTIRSGAPARVLWSAQVLYLPPAWVDEHVSDILVQHPKSTGEHDYALLFITGSATAAPLQTGFPFLEPDVREGIGFTGDEILVASYPAEFVGALTVSGNLYPASSVSTIGQLVTFGTSTIDALSLGGIIEAQSGSSGGAVVNRWGKLIGLIVTTSDGATTAERDLHALSLSYVDRDLKIESGLTLRELLEANPADKTADFGAHTAPQLIKLYRDVLFK